MRTRSMLAGLSLLLCVAGCGGGVTGSPEASTPSATPSATAGAIPAGTAPIEPGTYRVPKSAWSVADFTVAFPRGWTVQYGHVYLKHSDASDELSFYAVEVDEIFTDACQGGEDFTQVGPSVDDLAGALLRQPGPAASGPVKTTLGGYPATRIDLTVPKGFDLKPCNAKNIGLQIWYSPPADKYFVLLRDGTASVYIVDIDGQRQVFMTQYKTAASDEDVREMQRVLDSIEIGT